MFPVHRLRVGALASVLFLTGSLLADSLTLHTRRRAPAPDDPRRWAPVEATTQWDAAHTAIVICDMWDAHHCPDATMRVGEMAPRMNQVIQAARRRGVQIIHCPSDTMDFYKDHPGRALALAAPKVDTKVPLEGWCSLKSDLEAPLPIDDSDGGCDGCPDCPGYKAWSRQHPALEIMPGDAITDSVEAYYFMHQHGITNVIVMGVHANMCVLGRPFSIRQMVGQGQNVLLMRDLTDSMYNHRRAPFVSHFRGTELVVEHVEKFWCPSITSADFLGGEPFHFAGDKPVTIAYLIGEDEYDTARTVPAFARDNLEWRGVRSRFYKELPGKPGDFGGLDDLSSADALFISVRRRNLPANQMKRVRDFVASGKPVIGIRTASHAFYLRNGENPADKSWVDFDTSILGAHYEDHYGAGMDTVVTPVDPGSGDPLLAGLSSAFTVHSHLYKSRNPAPTVKVLLTGRTADGKSETEPVAWINAGAPGRTFYTSLGSPADFEVPEFRRMLLNGVLWAIEAFVPPPGASLDEPNRVPSHAAQPSTPPAAKKDTADTKPAPGPLPPQASAAKLKPAEGLAVDLVLAEPDIAQPVQIQFDARGRLWVVEYRQYPNPAGLKMVSHDNFWRAVYDKVPDPPPRHVRGLDRVTVHEDRDGDGVYETHKTFVDGLNIATSIAFGPDGVYVLNPPYLLHYPDANHDDAPDGDPQVLLSGFGLEDTHSVANSLRWGPDGWLYGCQGSTVTAHILVHGADGKPLPAPPVYSQGQNIWRYHPVTRRFEVFAEGGGNAFGLEIDAAGQVFSGHNGGDTRGFHYHQGAYLQKGFEKHGPLSNPYAFGYFPPMSHNKAERFTHTFVINDAQALGSARAGRLFGAEPLQGRIVEAAIFQNGTTFRTEDIGFALTSDDPWFKPVDIKLGPDGALYIADWYDKQVNHYRNHEGQMDPSSGRIYRLRSSDAPHHAGSPALDALAHLPGPEPLAAVEPVILTALQDPNRTVRQLAQRWIVDHATPNLRDRLASLVTQSRFEHMRHPEELLWALHNLGALDATAADVGLKHPDPTVRYWTVRFLGDAPQPASGLGSKLAGMARTETSPSVRLQLAASARRLSAAEGLPVVAALLRRDEDAAEPRQPLMLWWALEHWCEKDAAAVAALFDDQGLWNASIVDNAILARLARRFAATERSEDFQTLARLFKHAPDKVKAGLLAAGFEQAYEDRPIPDLPPALTGAMMEAGVGSVWLKAGLGDPDAVAEALHAVEDAKAPVKERVRLVAALANLRAAGAAPALARIAVGTAPAALRHAALSGLAKFDAPAIAPAVVAAFGSMGPDVRPAALALLASRRESAAALLDAVERGAVDRSLVDRNTVRRLRGLKAPDLVKRAAVLWPDVKAATTAELEAEVRRVVAVVGADQGDPYDGKKLFLATCAPCHKLFGQGASVGPDLTAYQRSDLETMALNVVAPNAEIREGYETYNLETKDGRSLSGFLVEQDPVKIVLRGLDGENTTIERVNLAEMTATGVSLMPEGLLTPMKDQQLRNLFAYLRSTQPLNDGN
jgi:putative heme-binding domain-containing protein